MQSLRGFTWLLALQAIGEGISRLAHVPLPGPVIGMVLLLGVLKWEPVRQEVAHAAQFLLAHLSLLFIPVGVGVMVHLPVLRQYGWRIAIVLVVSTWAGMAATIFAMRAFDGEATAPSDAGASGDGAARG